MRSDSTRAIRGSVLFCILDWGLGHATRCIPIIHAWEKRGFRVDIATDGRAYDLLKKEFPQHRFFKTPSYKVTYPFKSMRWNIFFQWPRIAQTISREHRWLKSHLRSHQYNVVVSDNRYGCFSKKDYSIMITHQVRPLTNGKVTDHIARWVSTLFLKRFDAVWIPDDEQVRLTGTLSKPVPAHGKFIGWVSRMQPNNSELTEEGLVVLSGPEPQRSYFEKKIRKQIHQENLRCRLVRGVPEGSEEWRQEDGLQVCDFLTSQDLEGALNQAAWVLSRSGYTSLMDYAVLGKAALMVPTPGQYEQEYLAETATMDHWVFTTEKKLNLSQQLPLLQKHKAKPYENKDLALAMDDVLGKLGFELGN